MTLKEALEIICKESIPKEINGVRTKYIIRNCKKNDEVRNYRFLPDYMVTIFPSDITKDNLSFSLSFNDESWAVDYTIERDTLAWKYLSEKIHQLLITYIKKIIEYFDGEVVETRVITVNPFNNEDADK
jgi:hypothetical protein